MQFTNYTNGGNNWENFLVVMVNGARTEYGVTSPTASVGVLLTMARQLLSVLLKIGLVNSLNPSMAPRPTLSCATTMVMASSCSISVRYPGREWSSV